MDPEDGRSPGRSGRASLEIGRIRSSQASSVSPHRRSFVQHALSEMAEQALSSAVKVIETKKEWATRQKLADSERFHTTAAYPLHHLWRQPRLRHNPDHPEEHGEMHEHWIELFNDLIMVAMLSNLSHTFEVGGQTFTNYGLCVVLWVVMMQSVHFVSYVVNVWQVDDFVLLICCFLVTTGTMLMSSGMKTDAHPPCIASWHENEKYVNRFQNGMMLSAGAQLVVLAQASFFEPRARSHAVVMACGNLLRLLILLLVPGLTKYVFMAVVVVLVYFALWNYTSILSLLDLNHLRARMDLMVLVSLGEWVITTILREYQMSAVVAQTALDLMLAAEYFNTRQHGHDAVLAMSARTPLALLRLESVELFLLQSLALCLFFFPATFTVATEFENQHPTDSETGRRLGGGDDDGGHGHAPHAPCNVDKTWTLSALRMHTATILCIVRFLLLFLFYVRCALCLVHVAIPLAGELGWSSYLANISIESLLGLHAVVVFADVVAELSLHQIANSTTRCALCCPRCDASFELEKRYVGTLPLLPAPLEMLYIANTKEHCCNRQPGELEGNRSY
ncbi:unnamed protein product [Durusdinium trenchii]|uniref:Transmembrane protein n=1 Tax=Durusdinium trenchii TaxID=1381693 RepID=A0ABP0H5V2_9DINO